MRKKQLCDSLVIRIAGDSGDGIQTIGESLADTSALMGNNIHTFPDYPSEIRAPAGSLPGVSGFQIQLGGKEILTPGDIPDALIVMNPAALKVNLENLKFKGLLIIDTGTFTKDTIRKAHFTSNPLEDDSLGKYYLLVKINITELTKAALMKSPLPAIKKIKCKNFFTLGLLFWIFSQVPDYTLHWITMKWPNKPELVAANTEALKAGYGFGKKFSKNFPQYQIQPAESTAGFYRKINGNDALVLGLIAASEMSKRPLLFASYPITPASSILEGMAWYKNFNIKTIQAEDEIAAIGMALGASFAGNLGVTATSGPGICLKSEFIGLAVITELPLIIINVQRGGPSTGLPTKTEQADLLQSMFGRNGESPVPVIAARSPGDCFDTALEAARIAMSYQTPVDPLLSDGYIAHSIEPWFIPQVRDLPYLVAGPLELKGQYIPYRRNAKTLARQQAMLGLPGFEHRIGGLEKDESGYVSHDPENHQTMCSLRAEKIQRIAKTLPSIDIIGPAHGKILILGWGSTYGAITKAVREIRAQGKCVSSIHLKYLNPMPNDLDELIHRFEKVVIPELNMGQLSILIRNKYMVNTVRINKIEGRPFTVAELIEKIDPML